MIFSKPLYYILKVQDHNINKEKLLSRISKSNFKFHNTDVKDYYSYISNTDWLSQINGVVFDWCTYSLSERDRESYSKLIYKKFGKKTLGINFTWFNQYYKKSFSEHAYHNHYCKEQPNDLANIYYVQLEDKSLRTILKHPVTGKEIIPRVKEGQILIFDAKIEHRSPKNCTNTTKTVISFNTRFL
tara:strand:- start:28 stop:585 length:558 start_codon:yes stop_codon:yes gene_type:complete